jgi:hypothetical protein
VATAETRNARAAVPALSTGLATASRSPLFVEAWVEYNRRHWRTTAERVVLGRTDGTPRLEAIFYRTRSGRIWQPPRNIYLPVAFETADDAGAHRVYKQWTDLAHELAGHMAGAGIKNTVNFLPELTDVRPWQWQGLLTGVKYTLYQDFPYDITQANQSVRSRVKKAQKAGYTCRRSDTIADVFVCLSETETRSGFHHHYTREQLDAAQRLVGREHFRCYTAYAPSGEPAASYVVLHNPGGYALAWVISTRTRHLPSGVTQLLHRYVAEDLEAAGATGFDLAGANTDSISAAKAGWGPRLVPYYSVQQYGPRRIAAYTFRGVQDIAGRVAAARKRNEHR